VIEHISREQGLAVLRTFARILKPGGRAVISTPNYRSLWPLIEWALDRTGMVPQLAEDQHVTFYHRRSLQALGEEAGLKLVAQRTVCFAAPWLALLSWRLAEAVHRLETSRPQPLGCLLMMSFEKARP
jgi:SAM-dependent methyltransferase